MYFRARAAYFVQNLLPSLCECHTYAYTQTRTHVHSHSCTNIPMWVILSRIPDWHISNFRPFDRNHTSTNARTRTCIYTRAHTHTNTRTDTQHACTHVHTHIWIRTDTHNMHVRGLYMIHAIYTQVPLSPVWLKTHTRLYAPTGSHTHTRLHAPTGSHTVTCA